jgi:hypothetical protein
VAKRNNYSFEKSQKENKRKKKQAEKLEKKRLKKLEAEKDAVPAPEGEEPVPTGETSSLATSALGTLLDVPSRRDPH